jgi:uncharacterized membrane protein YgcG
VTSLAKIAPWHHLAVGASVAIVAGATFTGLIGEDRPERYEHKQIVIAPSGTDGVRVTETVDIDFGDERRRGYQRIIPVDFGEPTQVTASSADAPDDISVEPFGWETRIRIGDPDVTVTGQHRYVLAYTLPDAHLSTGQLALDVIGTEETLETEQFDVVVTGLELADTTCNVGAYGDVGGCELVDDGETYRVSISPLEPGQGVTIGGMITGSRQIVAVPPPPLPDSPPDYRIPLGLAAAALGTVTGVGMYLWARRRGRNEVFSGGAADAAFGFSALPLPPPPAGSVAVDGTPPPPAPMPGNLPAGVRLVTDTELAGLATTEFAPPAGVDPWLGRVLLNEQLDAETVNAWLSAHAAHDVITVEQTDKGAVTLSIGPRFDDAAPEDRAALKRMLGSDGRIRLGKYSKSFAAEWGKVAKRQREFVGASGFWKRPIRGASGAAASGGAAMFVLAAVIALFVWRSAFRASPLLGSPLVALALSVLVPGLVALAAYRRLLPARTAVGSALAIRTESFRRFLAASEARHVEWAWSRGLLREYSAWAVALGTADAWESAIGASTVPPAELNAAPILLYHHAAVLSSTRVAPSSSGSGGGGFSGGGFSGGSVGGGGGGGSSGSW